ncbi:hypothetical protein ABTG57_18585, partial [Acinetobacter baumannii]
KSGPKLYRHYASRAVCKKRRLILYGLNITGHSKTMKQREITVLAAALAAFGIGFLTACGSGSNSAAATNANKEPVSVEVTTEQAVIRPIPTY